MAPRAAEEQGLIGVQQIQSKSVKPPGLQPSLEPAAAQLQGDKIWRERLKQLLQVSATLEYCIEELHRGCWADVCRAFSALMLCSMAGCFKRP